MPDCAPLEPGDPVSLGRYEVVGRIGAGGQGAVYLGKAPGGDGHVAIKLLHAQMNADPAARARFVREVQAAEKVAPFCTARVLDSQLDGENPYVVSEFVDGPPLFDVVVRDGPFSGVALERLAIGTATALAAIHEAGIVHRDFKPNNVLLALDGPRVIDFGIARTVNSDKSSVTATGMVVGTPGYLAPEQLAADPLTPAVDIFAWGATMMFAATGHSPFEADTLPVIINKILNEEPNLSALNGTPVLRDLVAAALAKHASRRPPAHQIVYRLLGKDAPAGAGAQGDHQLLGMGTQLAAKLPDIPGQPSGYRPNTPNPPFTPNPPYAGAGAPQGYRPNTPNPQFTPNPGYRSNAYAGQQPPRPATGFQTTGFGAPPYGGAPPFPQQRKSKAPLYIVLGCLGAVILFFVILVIIGIVAANNATNQYNDGYNGLSTPHSVSAPQ